MRKSVLLLAFAALCALRAHADEPVKREVIPGAEIMTPEEREAYRNRALVGDPARGAKAHQGCFSCHGVERYTRSVTRATASFIDSLLRASGLSDEPPMKQSRFKGRIDSLEALRAAVLRRNDYFNPKLTPQEVEDVVAYLNATYYKFPVR